MRNSYVVYYSFIDASGSILRKDPENFVLTSITIHESNLKYFNEKINEIKKKEFPEYDPNKIELHVKDMLKRKRFFQNVSREQTYQLLDKTFQFLSEPTTDYFIVSSIIKKELMYELTDIEEWAYRFVLERINKSVEFLNKQDNTIQKCKLIIDNEGEHNFGISSRIEWELKYGSKYSKFKFILGKPDFVDSKDNTMMQMTDCISYTIRKYHRKNRGNYSYTQKWREYYKSIEPKFSGKHTKYNGGGGLKIFPEVPILTSDFCTKNNITKLTVLDKPEMHYTDFGKKLQCMVQCNDTKNSLRMLNINQTSKRVIEKILGNLNRLVGYIIHFVIKQAKRFGKDIGLFTINKIEKNNITTYVY